MQDGEIDKVVNLKKALEPFVLAYARRIAMSGPWEHRLSLKDFEQAWNIYLKEFPEEGR